MKKTKKRIVKKKEVKEEQYLDLRPKPQMAPIFHNEIGISDMLIKTINEAADNIIAMAKMNEFLKFHVTVNKPILLKKETEEQRKTRMTIENATLDNKRRPSFALEAYKESLDNGNTRL